MDAVAAVVDSHDVLPRFIFNTDRVLGRRSGRVDVHFTFAFVDPEPGHVPILFNSFAALVDGDGVVQRLAGDDDPDVSEAGFNALKAREERVRDDSSCAVDFGSQSTVAMDLAEAEPVEPADVEVVDDSAAAGAAVS